jgi:hypothetical protein
MAIVILVINSSRHSKKQDDAKQNFLDEEEAANLVRKKEIDPALFYTADLSVLPPSPEGDPHQVERSAKRVMIRFENYISNLELKKMYGLSQMDLIAQYEENFNEYLKALTKWGASVAEENPQDAVKILEHVISLGGEYRDTYKIAADIYTADGDKEKLQALIVSAEKNHFSDPAVRQQILDYIGEKLP